jgi:hypothetical protein
MLTITFKKIGKFIKFILSGSLTEISFEGDKENEKKEVKGMKKTAPQQQKLESTIKNIFGMATTAVIAASLYYHIIWKHKKNEAEEL